MTIFPGSDNFIADAKLPGKSMLARRFAEGDPTENK